MPQQYIICIVLLWHISLAKLKSRISFHFKRVF